MQFGPWVMVAAATLIWTPASSKAGPVLQFPVVEATDLAGEARKFPSGLPNDPTLLVVAFQRGQQGEVDRVLALIALSQPWRSGYPALEIPVIEDPGSAARFFIDNGMKNGIADAQKRKSVVTLYVKNLAEWQAATGATSTSNVYVLGVGRDGRILKSASTDKLRNSGVMQAFIQTIRDAVRK